MTKKHLQEVIRETTEEIRTLNELLDREDIDLIRLYIRRELAQIFYDLFKKKNIWI